MALLVVSGMASPSRQLVQASSTSDGRPAFGPAIPGTGFKNPPPLPIISGIFEFLKFVGLSNEGLGVVDVPFHGGWVLVEWRSFLSVAEWVEVEFERICEEIESEERTKGQIDLNLGPDFGLSDEEPPVEVPGVVPTVVVESDEEEVLLEEVVSKLKRLTEQAAGTGRAVPEEDREILLEEVVRADEAVPDVEETGELPDPMAVDPTVRTGGQFEEVRGEVDPDLGPGGDDLREEDFPEDVFEKVGDLSPVQSCGPAVQAHEQAVQSPLDSVPRKKRMKTLAGRTDLPWVRKLQALRAQSSAAPPAQPTRKSFRLAAQETRGKRARQGSPSIEEIPSSSEGSPIRDLDHEVEHPAPPVRATEQTDSDSSPESTPRPAPKRKAVAPSGSATPSSAGPFSKRPRTELTLSEKLDKFQRRGIVRGKIVRASYFRDQGLEVFLDKLQSQGGFELFANTELGCSPADVVEFYANVALHGDVLSSTVNGVLIEVDAQALGVILGIPATGFDFYVREDKSLLGRDKLLELSRHLSQQPGLRSPIAVKKSDMQPIHQLLFWFVIKNVIPRAQGRNQADAMDQALIDLMDRGEQINLPAFMINHIMRIATTTRAHDLGYGFLLTRVFEHFGVDLRKKADAGAVDEIGGITISSCGFELITEGGRR